MKKQNEEAPEKEKIKAKSSIVNDLAEKTQPASDLRIMHLEELFDRFFRGESPEPLKLIGSSDSMKPAIMPGEIIRILPINDHAELCPGDVIIFRQNGIFVGHRLVRRKDKYVIAKGDNSPFCDPPVLFSDIVGIVEGKSSRWRLYYYLLVRKKILSYLFCFFKDMLISLRDRSLRKGQ